MIAHNGMSSTGLARIFPNSCLLQMRLLGTYCPGIVQFSGASAPRPSELVMLLYGEDGACVLRQVPFLFQIPPR